MTEPADVLHVVPAYFPMRGGIEVLIENLADLIRENSGMRSAVMTRRTRPEEPLAVVHRGVVVHTVPPLAAETTAIVGPGLRDMTAQGALVDVSQLYARTRAIFDSCRPHLVHVHSSTTFTVPAVNVARSLGIPVIFHLHGTIDESNSPAFRRQVRDADWVCAVSEAVATSIRVECSRTQTIRVIRNGVNDPSPSMIPHNPVSPSVAMIGRLSPEKGFDDGLRALTIVRETFPDLTIRIVGNGPEQRALLQVARELNLANSIEYFGELAHDRALRVIAGSDVVAVPSRRVEGFSLVAVEAALLQRPVVATTVGGLPETVLDGQTGILVPPGDSHQMAAALTSLLDDPEKRNRLGVHARAQALHRFDMKRFVDDIATLYTEVLGEGLGQPGQT